MRKILHSRALVFALLPGPALAGWPGDSFPTPNNPIPHTDPVTAAIVQAAAPQVPPTLRRTFLDPTAVPQSVQELGNEAIVTAKGASGSTLIYLKTKGNEALVQVQTLPNNTVKTFSKAMDDAQVTYVKAWRDTAAQGQRDLTNTAAQGQRDLENAADAVSAVAEYTKSEANDAISNGERARSRAEAGKIVDSIWGLAVEPAQSSEKNFSVAVHRSVVLNDVAEAAASYYGGPAGAAAYAAWYTYRETGDANLALRMGILAAVESEAGSEINGMPSGTTSEWLKKAAVSGAAGGIAVAAAGGTKDDIKNAFLMSAGNVIIQGGNDRLRAYSPKAADAVVAIHCISARDVGCLAKTTYAKTELGKFVYNADGTPKIEAIAEANEKVGEWTGYAADTVAAKRAAFMAAVGELPDSHVIPILDNQWVLTYTIGNQKEIPNGTPTVVLTYVGKRPPFTATASYVLLKRYRVARAPQAMSVHHELAARKGYACSVGGFERSVTTMSSSSGCTATYRRSGTSYEIVWQSRHDPAACTAKAATFVQELARKGIHCTR